MTKPSSTLPVLYARVPVKTYALAQLLSGAGKTSISKWIADLIETQRGTLGGQPLPPYAQPVKRRFTFASDNAHTRELRYAVVRLADWVLRTPDIRKQSLPMTLLQASRYASPAGLCARRDDFLYQTMCALDLMRDLVVMSPNGTKTGVFEITTSIELLPESQVVIGISRLAAEIWDENEADWWEMVRTLPRILAPQYWADVDAHEAKTQQAITVASADAYADHEPGYAVAAVAPVKRGRGRPRKVQPIDREDGHARAAEAACSGDDQ
jgi:hypothetical protein